MLKGKGSSGIVNSTPFPSLVGGLSSIQPALASQQEIGFGVGLVMLMTQKAKQRQESRLLWSRGLFFFFVGIL